MNKKSIGKKILYYFFQGLLFVAPITLTIWALVITFNYIDGLLIHYLDELLGVHIPGLGLVVLLAFITLVGLLGSTIIFKPFGTILTACFRVPHWSRSSTLR